MPRLQGISTLHNSTVISRHSRVSELANSIQCKEMLRREIMLGPQSSVAMWLWCHCFLVQQSLCLPSTVDSEESQHANQSITLTLFHDSSWQINKDAELCVATSSGGYCLDSPCPTTKGATCPRILSVKHWRMTAEQVRGHLANCRCHLSQLFPCLIMWVAWRHIKTPAGTKRKI